MRKCMMGLLDMLKSSNVLKLSDNTLCSLVCIDCGCHYMRTIRYVFPSLNDSSLYVSCSVPYYVLPSHVILLMKKFPGFSVDCCAFSVSITFKLTDLVL